MLDSAIRALRRDHTDQAVASAREAARLAKTAAARQTADQIVAEAFFRAGCQAAEPAERLEYLDLALEASPGEVRFRFHRAIALWQLDRLEEAATELETVAVAEPERPKAAFMLALARLALTGTPAAGTADLSPAEAATLDLVGRLLQGEAPDPDGAITSLAGGSRVSRVWPALASMVTDPSAAPMADLERAIRTVGGRGPRKIVEYYHGVAAMRAGDRSTADQAWHRAWQAGFGTDWAARNRQSLLRETAADLAEAGQWRKVAALSDRAPQPVTDFGLAELLAIASDHIGYAAAQKGSWHQAADHWMRARDLAPTRQRIQNLALAAEQEEDWITAAESWREMVRRRPRKTDHPDYLTDSQVAGIWTHAASCYDKVGDAGEAVTCLKTALKYAETDVDLRLKLVEALLDNEQEEAAENELDRILKAEANHLEALILLGTLRLRQWGDVRPLWRRALTIAPRDVRVRDGLAMAHLEQLSHAKTLSRNELESDIGAALEELPDHPDVLLRAAELRRIQGRNDEARDLLWRAHAAAPTEVRVTGALLHEMLHVSTGDETLAFMEEVRRFPKLLPLFWIDQGRLALQCNMPREWVIRLFDEAVELAGRRIASGAGRGDKEDTQAAILLRVFDSIHNEQGDSDLLHHYAEIIGREVPDSGAVQYIEAHRAMYFDKDAALAKRLLKEAVRKARRAGEPGVEDAASEELHMLTMSPGTSDLLRRMMELFPDGPPDPRDLENLPDEFFEDLFR